MQAQHKIWRENSNSAKNDSIYFRYTLPSAKIDLNVVAQEFIEITNETMSKNATNNKDPNSVVPYFKERVAIMNSILKRFMIKSGVKFEAAKDDISYDAKVVPMLDESQVNESLEDSLLELWTKINHKGEQTFFRT